MEKIQQIRPNSFLNKYCGRSYFNVSRPLLSLNAPTNSELVNWAEYTEEAKNATLKFKTTIHTKRKTTIEKVLLFIAREYYLQKLNYGSQYNKIYAGENRKKYKVCGAPGEEKWNDTTPIIINLYNFCQDLFGENHPSGRHQEIALSAIEELEKLFFVWNDKKRKVTIYDKAICLQRIERGPNIKGTLLHLNLFQIFTNELDNNYRVIKTEVLQEITTRSALILYELLIKAPGKLYKKNTQDLFRLIFDREQNEQPGHPKREREDFENAISLLKKHNVIVEFYETDGISCFVRPND